MSSEHAQRPLVDRVEVAAPSFAAVIARVVARLPASVRRRALNDAFARAEAAFNRGDFEAIFALFAEDVHYVPPPALEEGAINGRAAVLAFWHAIARRFDATTIRNLSVEEVASRRFVRTARITHRTNGDELSYAIRQVTDLRGGRVVSQINEQISER
jgi:ketosteroid isomerase-like protein